MAVVDPVPPKLSSLLDALKARKDLLDFAALPSLLDVGTVAALCHCSPRHIYRLSYGGRCPPPVNPLTCCTPRLPGSST